MKAVLWCVALLLTAEPLMATDRSEITAVIQSLNSEKPVPGTFASGTDPAAELAHLQSIHQPGPGRPDVIGMNEPWTKMTKPRISVTRIRVQSPEHAVAEGISRVEGAVTMRREVPLRFVLRREEDKWRIVSIRSAR